MDSRKQNYNSTIFALASGFGRSGIAIIRVSGPEARQAYSLLTGNAPLPAPREAKLQKFFHPVSKSLLDHGLALFFPSPRSYTGEDVVEYHLHGGSSVIRSFLAALSSCPGLRLAERGEFTKRAFLNGHFDLTAAEGVADLINAETEAQRHQALRQMSGELAVVYHNWRDQLLEALAYEEATIDFVDEDLDQGVPSQVLNLIEQVAQQVTSHLQDRRGEKVRDGLQVVILGAPNVGKSSLLNVLAKRDCAIVTEQPGTTRDLIEVHIDLNGLPVTLIDTAGLREAVDLIEKEGIRRSHLKAAEADLKLLLVESPTLLAPFAEVSSKVDKQTILVVNKTDLGKAAADLPQDFPCPVVSISAKTGAGVHHLLQTISSCLEKQVSGSDSPVMTNARHREALDQVAQALETVISNPTAPPELTAEELRIATNALGQITGRINVEHVLEKIFSSFCIGK